MLQSIKPVGGDATSVAPYNAPEAARKVTVDGQQGEQGQKTQERSSISQELLSQVENEIKQIHNVGLLFSVHRATGKTMIKVVDKATDKLVREIPPEDFLDLSAKLEEMMGILFDKKV